MGNKNACCGQKSDELKSGNFAGRKPESAKNNPAAAQEDVYAMVDKQDGDKISTLAVLAGKPSNEPEPESARDTNRLKPEEAKQHAYPSLDDVSPIVEARDVDGPSAAVLAGTEDLPAPVVDSSANPCESHSGPGP